MKPPFKNLLTILIRRMEKRNAKATDPQRTQMQREDDSDGYKDWRAYEDQLMKLFLTQSITTYSLFFKSNTLYWLDLYTLFLLLTGSVVHIQLFTSDDTKDLLEREFLVK